MCTELFKKTNKVNFESKYENHVMIFVAFVEGNATMSSIQYFDNHVSYFVRNRRK